MELTLLAIYRCYLPCISMVYRWHIDGMSMAERNKTLSRPGLKNRLSRFGVEKLSISTWRWKSSISESTFFSNLAVAAPRDLRRRFLQKRRNYKFCKNEYFNVLFIGIVFLNRAGLLLQYFREKVLSEIERYSTLSRDRGFFNAEPR